MLAILPLVLTLAAVIHDIDDFGASRADASAVHVNAAAFESALAASNPGDTVRISPGLPYYMQKVQAASVRGVTISIEGELRIDSNFTAWGTLSKHLTFINLADSTNVTFTGGGLIDGQGMPWWDASITGSTPNLGEHRPNMFHFTNVTDLIIEHLNLKNSPHFHLYFTQCARVTIRFVTIDVDRFAQRKLKARAHAKRIASLGAPWAGRADDISRRIYALAPAGTATGTGFGAAATSSQDWRDAILDELVKLLPAWVLQPEDLNTDGIDPNGRDFHVHDTAINNDDDSIAVKPSDGADTCAPRPDHPTLPHLSRSSPGPPRPAPSFPPFPSARLLKPSRWRGGRRTHVHQAHTQCPRLPQHSCQLFLIMARNLARSPQYPSHLPYLQCRRLQWQLFS